MYRAYTFFGDSSNEKEMRGTLPAIEKPRPISFELVCRLNQIHFVAIITTFLIYTERSQPSVIIFGGM
ncbi:hypothetical protein [Rhodoplanes sp. P11]|uniref:hypothetical protein n=1 Tax=Rhodoplanes sp. P11 TaxID=3157621 RepID=UPI0013EDFB71